jgi:hypothetical protein
MLLTGAGLLIHSFADVPLAIISIDQTKDPHSYDLRRRTDRTKSTSPFVPVCYTFLGSKGLYLAPICTSKCFTAQVLLSTLSSGVPRFGAASD